MMPSLKAAAVLLTAAIGSLTPLVSASLPNLGFGVSINTTRITVRTASGHRQDALAGSAFAAPYSTLFNFSVPVTITRLSSSQDALTLTLSTRPYDYDLDEAPAPVQVYQEEVYLNEYPSREYVASFTISTRNTNVTDYYLSAQVDINGNPSGQSTAFRAAVPGAGVLSYNSTSGLWTAIDRKSVV